MLFKENILFVNNHIKIVKKDANLKNEIKRHTKFEKSKGKFAILFNYFPIIHKFYFICKNIINYYNATSKKEYRQFLENIIKGFFREKSIKFKNSKGFTRLSKCFISFKAGTNNLIYI